MEYNAPSPYVGYTVTNQSCTIKFLVTVNTSPGWYIHSYLEFLVGGRSISKGPTVSVQYSRPTVSVAYKVTYSFAFSNSLKILLKTIQCSVITKHQYFYFNCSRAFKKFCTTAQHEGLREGSHQQGPGAKLRQGIWETKSHRNEHCSSFWETFDFLVLKLSCKFR